MRNLVLSLSLSLAMVFNTPAYSEIDPGDHAWIVATPIYKTKSGQHCCSMRHCKPMMENEVVRVKGGWLHIPSQTFLMDGDVGIYTSEVPRVYGCIWGYGNNRQMVCLFTVSGA